MSAQFTKQGKMPNTDFSKMLAEGGTISVVHRQIMSYDVSEIFTNLSQNKVLCWFQFTNKEIQAQGFR